jgi:nucleotide-binding universal stress UspA family protein
MSSPAPLLVGIDFTPSCLVALRTAIRLARASSRAVYAVHVIDQLVLQDLREALPDQPVDLEKQLMGDTALAWRDFIASEPDMGAVRFEAAIGHRIDGLLAAARALKPELVVLGAFGNRTARVGAGTMATAAVRKMPHDVLLVRDNAGGALRSIVVGVDYSETSLKALRAAIALAAREGATVHALHIFNGPWHTLHYRAPTPEADPHFIKQYRDALERRLRAVVEEARAAVGADTPEVGCSVVDEQSVRSTLMDQAVLLGADLVVIGTRGRANLRDLLLGSTAEKLLRELNTSVLAVKPAD